MTYVSISGAVGAGKTTLLNQLLDHYGSHAQAREERPQDNPFISAYYADANRWSFQSQAAFLAMYFDQPTWKEPTGDFYFYDRCLLENLVIAQYRMETGSLCRDEFDTLTKLANGIASCMPPVDKYIYLRCSVPLLVQRFQLRGRAYEQQLGQAYAEHQKRLYDAWAETLPKDKVLIVDEDEGVDLEKIIAFLEK